MGGSGDGSSRVFKEQNSWVYFESLFFLFLFLSDGGLYLISCWCRLGLKLLARVKPSEIFLKSISKEVTDVEVNYPSRFFLLSLTRLRYV